MLKKAERNLNELLDEKKDKKIKADITKFIAETIGKKIYSKKTEVEHSGDITHQLDDRTKSIALELLKKIKDE